MKTYTKWGLIVIGVLAAIVLVLRNVGNIFINELTQDVSLQVYENKSITADLNKEAPFFELMDLSGNKVKVSDFLGSPVVIIFWTTWNAQATNQIKVIDDYLLKNKNSLFKVITINNQEDKSIVSNFIKRGGYQVPVLIDEKGEVGEAYQAKNLPAAYFLNKDGIVKDIFVGVLNEKMLVDKSGEIIR